jgi:cobalt-precorrin 5A hydrolase/precorrin-3B C17-methyltransferase
VTSSLAGATDLVGYGPYLELAGCDDDAIARHAFDNREEAARARFALDLAAQGRNVVVVSSGDPGIFGMATAIVEELEHARDDFDVDVVIAPGVTAASAVAARVGAPLGHDFCCLSLSDLRKPWTLIERRLEAVGVADLVVALYNPASRRRESQLVRALEILGRHRAPETPVVLGTAIGRDGEAVCVTTLGELDATTVDMRTIVIVGSTTTRVFRDVHDRQWVYTPRSHPDDA